MLEVEQSAAASTLRSGNLQLSFHYDRDRWRHVLAIRGETGWETVLTSIEGSPEQTLPPSPSFQDLRLERIDSETGEFQLFGQAGQAVYSAAIRFDGKSQAISFDIAARAQREGGERCAMTRYELSPSVSVKNSEAPEKQVLGTVCGTLVLSVPQGIVIDRSAHPSEPGSSRLTVAMHGHSGGTSGDGTPSRNARWQYEIRFAPRP
jgi:hypothetical protein